MQDQIIVANSKYPTGFDKVVSSGMFSSYFFQVIFPLMMEFIVPKNLISRKHYHFILNIEFTLLITLISIITRPVKIFL